MKKVAFYTLGCKVNQYETNAMTEQFIKSNYEIGTYKIIRKLESKDGTKKFLFDILDGNAIETVLMDYKFGRYSYHIKSKSWRSTVSWDRLG